MFNPMAHVLGNVAGVESSLQFVLLVLGVINTLGGIAVWILALYVGKRFAEERIDRDQQRREDKEKVDAQFDRLVEEIHSLTNRLDKELFKMLLDIGEKYAQKSEVYERYGALDASTKAAHNRIDKLREDWIDDKKDKRFGGPS